MNIIKEKRLEKNLTLEQVGNLVGVGKSTVRKWENGLINNMGRENIVSLSKALDISPLDILGVEEIHEDNLHSIYKKLNEENKNKLEYYGKSLLDKQNNKITDISNKAIKSIENSYVAANPSALSYGDYVIAEEVYDQYKIPKGAEFKIKVKGDSMSELIPDGSDVFYKKQETIENGEIAIVEIENEGITCKKVYFNYNDKKIILHSLNEKYDDLVLPANKVKIIGKVLFNN